MADEVVVEILVELDRPRPDRPLAGLRAPQGELAERRDVEGAGGVAAVPEADLHGAGREAVELFLELADGPALPAGDGEPHLLHEARQAVGDLDRRAALAHRLGAEVQEDESRLGAVGKPLHLHLAIDRVLEAAGQKAEGVATVFPEEFTGRAGITIGQAAQSEHAVDVLEILGRGRLVLDDLAHGIAPAFVPGHAGAAIADGRTG